MKIVIFQFSGTGNTWFVASHLQQAFQAQGASCDVLSIEALTDAHAAIESADIIGLGYPIYGSDFPEPVMTLIENLGRHQDKRAFVYCTQMMYSGDGAALGAKALRKKGFIVRQLAHVNMPNNITDYRIVRWVKPMKPDRLTRKVVRKTRRFASAILADKRIRKGETIFSLLLGLVQRIPFRRGREVSKGALIIDQTCIGCSLCVDLCPSGNLTMVDEHAKVADQCYLCYRCVNHCPVQAIHFAKRTTVIRPYQGPTPDFDIRDVSRHHLE